jgi:geranylgeranyl diphosphate synthase, type I
MTRLDTELGRYKDAYLEQIFACIDRAVERSLGRDSSLVEMLAYHMETGGKRLRALLPLMVAEALGAKPQSVLAFGAACEMIHNATLVHDDLQDGDRMRRGRETVWARYGAARAINLGDAMLYLGNVLVEDLEVDPALRLALMQRISRDVLKVIDGQEREFLLKELDEPGLDDYFRMVEGKTSGLFALPIVGAAELCGAEKAVVEALERVSGHLGIVFQIQDDVLDLYGDKGRDQVGSDLFEGKISVLVAHFLSHATPEDAEQLKGLLRTPREEVDYADVLEAIAALRREGSLGYALDEVVRRRSLIAEESALEPYPALMELVKGIVEVFLAPIASIMTAEGRR